MAEEKTVPEEAEAKPAGCDRTLSGLHVYSARGSLAAPGSKQTVRAMVCLCGRRPTADEVKENPVLAAMERKEAERARQAGWHKSRREGS